MNKEYYKKDDEVIVIDDKNNKKNIKYYDNLDEVLIKENLIESIENKISDLEKDTKNFNLKKELKKANIKSLILLLLITFFPLIIFSTLTFSAQISSGIVLVNAARNALYVGLSLEMIVGPFTLLGGTLITYFEKSSDIKYIKNKKGELAQLEYLKKELSTEKDLLDKLKNDLTNLNKSDILVNLKVNDLEELKKLRKWLKTYYNIGYNEEKYLEYYKKDVLNKKLSKKYPQEEVEFIEKYIEDNIITLVKKQK